MPNSKNSSSGFHRASVICALAIIGWYRNVLSLEHGVLGSVLKPLLPYGFGHSGCRFFPSCSGYAETAIRQYGLLKGFVLSLRRISRCGPWNTGGFDPVPHTRL